MPWFTDVIELEMKDSRNNLVEKYTFDVRKRNIQIKVKPGYEAIVNNTKFLGGQTQDFTKKNFGDSVIAFVYQPARLNDPILIPFFAGQHTVSLDTHKTAKAKFALVGEASVEVADYMALARYFDATISLQDVENRLNEVFKDPFSTQVTAAAKTHINSASTDVSLYSELPAIAKDASHGSAAKKLFDMGLVLGSRGIAMRLNPIGETSEIIDRINDAFNNKAMEQFDEEKIEKLRGWEIEDRNAANQHEIDVINAHHTNTSNQNTSNTYNYNGNVPQQPVQEPRQQPKRHFCPNCGRELQGHEAYCPDCGNKIVK
ncbi:MAG: zinc ribbon domain-containing protein [Bacilli bacterium]|nr:zinc ribbon domain-containing protein [Bacilli bacterium]